MASPAVKVIEDCRVSPPPNSTPATSIPLTFFDITWLFTPSVERILFYEFPHSTETILPQLKHSLSLALQHFFPLAGKVVLSPPQSTAKPHILCTNGDSVPLLMAESSADFAHLLKNYPRDVREFHPLVRRLSPLSSDALEASPLLAFQITIFPNSGISISISYRHVACDGRTIMNFIKSWTSIFRSNGDLSKSLDLPLTDRESVTKIDPDDKLFNIYYNQWWKARSFSVPLPRFDDRFRATFLMRRQDINNLKKWVTSTEISNCNIKLSSFVVTCAFLWVCLIKTANNLINNENPNSSSEDIPYYFVFAADCTGDGKEIYVPKTYFGNCLRSCFVSVNRNDLLGENGFLMAVKAIGNEVKELEKGVLTGVENWIMKALQVFSSGRVVTIASSPKLRVYETDFGWGKPKKTEVVHIDSGSTFALTESRDEEGGFEVGVALSKLGMETFISIFEKSLKNFS